MEKELLNTFDKELLLKDLCARLPYDTVCQVEFKNNGRYESKNMILSGIFKDEAYFTIENGSVYSNDYKPYLFPLTSITEEQKMFLKQQNWCIAISTRGTVETTIEGIDWLNKNHFDYRGLIKRGLAIDATGLNIY